jgi:hypothetical protein
MGLYSGCAFFLLVHPTRCKRWISFPIREYGVNYQAQPLQRHEIQAMVADEAIIARILESYRLMLDFYGMQLESPETGRLSRSEPEHICRERYRNLVRKLYSESSYQGGLTKYQGASHNNLRISRILKSLSEFGLEHLNAGFLLHVLNEQSEHNKLNTAVITRSMDQWWANCIRNDEERTWIGSLIKKVRTDEEFVFKREMYEQALERRRETGRLGCEQ